MFADKKTRMAGTQRKDGFAHADSPDSHGGILLPVVYRGHWEKGLWCRWSHQRVSPEVWEAFKTVKPKEPRAPPKHLTQGNGEKEVEASFDESVKQTMVRTMSFKNLQHTDDIVSRQMHSMLSQPSFHTRKQHPLDHSSSSKSMARRGSMSRVGGFSVAKPLMHALPAMSSPPTKAPATNARQLQADIQAAFIEIMVAAADPQGDFSWTVPDPRAFMILPKKLIECGDWHAFRVIMCDLRFLWRKIQENGLLSVLQTYEMANVPLAAHGYTSDRMQDYQDFVLQHVKMLSMRPNSIFQLGMSSQQLHVRRETKALVAQYEKIIEEWHDRFIQDAQGASSKRVAHLRAGEHRKQHVSAFETMRYVNMKSKLAAMHECGMSACLSDEAQKKLTVLIERLVQKVQSSRSRLLEKGLEAYTQENRAILGLDMGGVDTGQDLEQPKQFLDLAGLWDESDKVEFVTLSIYIPPKTWNNEKLRDTFESNLCNQVAEAAHAPLELIDIVEIACPEKDAKKGMYGKVLMKCMELVKGLQVTVVAGKDFPVMDQVGKSDPLVTLNLRTARTRGHSSPRRSKQMEKKPPRMALKAQQTAFQTQSRPGELNPVNPNFDESFSFLIYDLGQDLVVICYDQDKGGKTPIGEVVLNIEDIFSQCHTYDDETFERAFQLCKPGTKKVVTYRTHAAEGSTRTPTVLLRFKFFTHQSPSGITPHKMANDVMLQARDPNSQLRLGCIVMGPAFHDEAGSWDTVRVYLSSAYGEFHAERRYLDRFVFPALAVDCLGQRLHFKWTDLSGYGAHGVKDDIVKRLDAVDECRIRSYDKNGDNINSVFMVALIGEKRGRLVDGHDIRKLEKAESLRKGKYEWALEAARQGVSVQELEIRSGLLNDPSTSEAVICIRDPFADDENFQNTVPKHVKAVFTESDIAGRTAVGALKRNVMRAAGQSVVHYSPQFLGYTEQNSEGSEQQQQHADKAGERVVLGGLEEFGLEVFERLWRHIRQRFSSSRAKSAVNGYVIEHANQIAAVSAYVRPFFLVQGQSQRLTLDQLTSCANFIHIWKPVTLLTGTHGSGKSSLLARLIHDLGGIPQQKEEEDESVEETKDSSAPVSQISINTNTHGPHRLRPTVMAMLVMRTVAGSDRGKIKNTSSINKTFDPLSPEDEDFDFGDDGDVSQTRMDLNEVEAPATVEATEEEQRQAEEEVNALLRLGLTHEDILFLARRPRLVFFMKQPHHSTADLISFLCSSMLRHQDLRAPSWKRLEQIIRSRVYERPLARQDITTPVLLILDSLSAAERDQVRAIVCAFKGRARAIMTVDSTSLVDMEGSPARGGTQFKQTHVILNGPLANAERNEILSKLFDRLGAKRKPANLDVITLRPAAGSPLYLSVAASYIRSLCSMYQRPLPLRQLRHDTVDIVTHDLLPVIEQIAGVQQVRTFLEVVMLEPTGRSKKDVHAILYKCGSLISESTLRVLNDAFRPFSDPVHSSSGGPLSLTRSFIREAVRKRYHELQPLGDISQKLKDLRVGADAQEARLHLMRLGGLTQTRRGGTSESSDSDADDAQWLSDQEEGKEDGLNDSEAVEVVAADRIVVQFGNKPLLVDEALFLRFCSGGDTGINAQRANTMDMNELVKMLRFVNILPQHVTKSEIAKAFRSANRDHGLSKSSDSDVHELDFREFLDCMALLEEISMNRLNMMGTQHERAATIIQKRARGIAARREARRRRLQIEAQKLDPNASYDEDDVKRVVKLQALARAKKEREKQQRKILLHNASESIEQHEMKMARPAVKGRVRKEGALAVMQARLMELFDTALEAFVFLDNDGNDRITKVEFGRGLQRIGIAGGNIGKLSAMVAADGIVDVLEFLRLFSWHDIRHVDHAIAEAKLQRNTVIAKAAEKLQALREDNEAYDRDLNTMEQGSSAETATSKRHEGMSTLRKTGSAGAASSTKTLHKNVGASSTRTLQKTGSSVRASSKLPKGSSRKSMESMYGAGPMRSGSSGSLDDRWDLIDEEFDDSPVPRIERVSSVSFAM